MGSLADLLSRAKEAGLSIELRGDKLRLQGPPSSSELARSLLAAKAEITELLRNDKRGGDAATVTQLPNSAGSVGISSPRGSISSPDAPPSETDRSPGDAAREAWLQAIEQVAGAWEQHAKEARAAGREPTWIEDEVLQDQVRSALLSGDLDRSLTAIKAWRMAWETAIAAALGVPPALRSATTQLPAQVLNAWLDDPVPVRRVAAHMEIHSRVDAMIEESEGRRPHWNQSVHDMFDETRARLGSRYLEERSITSWLRKHTPAVAALWPDAPLTAAWIDWRQRVGREHLAVLDRGLDAVTRRSKQCRNGGQS